jgi:hypothetical protein
VRTFPYVHVCIYFFVSGGHRFLCIDLISSCDADLHVVDATIRFSVLLVGLLV